MISGTTALVALYRPVEQKLYVAWVGDSKALLVSQNRILQIVQPHKPDMEVSLDGDDGRRNFQRPSPPNGESHVNWFPRPRSRPFSKLFFT